MNNGIGTGSQSEKTGLGRPGSDDVLESCRIALFATLEHMDKQIPPIQFSFEEWMKRAAVVFDFIDSRTRPSPTCPVDALDQV